MQSSAARAATRLRAITNAGQREHRIELRGGGEQHEDRADDPGRIRKRPPDQDGDRHQREERDVHVRPLDREHHRRRARGKGQHDARSDRHPPTRRPNVRNIAATRTTDSANVCD